MRLPRTGADGSAQVTPAGGPADLATEPAPGAARLADTLFRTIAEPWCPDHF
ncbi:hypothetical protein ACWEJQ_23890 [Streptomyces albidoflavus]